MAYQLGNTSSRTITEVKATLSPVSTWMGDFATSQVLFESVLAKIFFGAQSTHANLKGKYFSSLVLN